MWFRYTPYTGRTLESHAAHEESHEADSILENAPNTEEGHAGLRIMLFGNAVADRDHDDDIPASNLLPSSLSDALGRFPSDHRKRVLENLPSRFWLAGPGVGQQPQAMTARGTGNTVSR